MRLPGRHVLYALSAVTMLAACSSNGARGGIASTNMNPTNPPATAETATVSPTPAPQSARTETWINLQVGDCLADLPPADLSRITVTIVDCATAHSAEVYLRAPVAVDAAVVSMANRDCAAGFAPYTGQSVDTSPYSVAYLIDSHQDRTGADPTPSTVICLLQPANGQLLTGSPVADRTTRCSGAWHTTPTGIVCCRDFSDCSEYQKRRFSLMTTPPDKARRRFLRDAYKNAERVARTALLTIDQDQLEQLLDYVDERLGEQPCDHTARHAQRWAQSHRIEWETLAEGLQEFGGYCDCEIVMNVEPEAIFG